MRWTGIALAVCSLAAVARADDAGAVQQKLDRVLQRLEAVEAENRSLKERIEKLEVVPAPRASPAAPSAVDQAKAVPPPPRPRAQDEEPGADGAPSPFDAHLDRTAPPRANGVRLFGDLAINSWAGQKNVAVRAGPNGTTDIWDAATGVAATLGPDTALRMRLFTVLPTIGGDGDGFGNGRDFAYLRDAYIVQAHLFGSDALNLRFGRMPYAFGDEYLQFDAPANPLVSHSAAFFWGFDEGMQLFGPLGGGISYTLVFNTDGQVGNGADATSSKARGLKVGGDHGPWHWSASYLHGANTRVSEIWIGAQATTPVGAFGATGAPGGVSPSPTVGSEFYELDGGYDFHGGHVSATAGRGTIEDDGIHSRQLEWFKLEPTYWFRPRWYAAARWSDIHVRDATQGYAFRPFESGTADFGFDVNELERLSLGIGFRAGDRMTYKLEHTADHFFLIPGALPAAHGTDGRDYTVLQAAAEF